MRLWCFLVVGWTIGSLPVLSDDTWWLGMGLRKKGVYLFKKG